MKKLILLFGFLVTINLGYSQVSYSYYLDSTSEWRYHRIDFNIYTGENNDYYNTLYFDGTEIYNGFVYYKRYNSELKITHYNGSSDSTSQLTLIGPNLVREDSDGVFYVLNPETNTDYPFFQNQLISTAQIGSQYQYTTNNCTVQSISNYVIGTLSLKKINGTISGTSAGTLEGVGNIGNFCSISYEGGDTTLNCYKKQDTEIQFGTINCDLFPVPNRIGLGVESFNDNNSKFAISPNPANEVLNIKSNQNTAILSVNIYNSIAQLVYSSFSNCSQLDVSNLKTGIYIVEILTENKVYNNRFIKK